MHIPDGYLGPQTYVALDAAVLPAWAIAAHRVKKTMRSKQVPLLALGAAFSFVTMMFNVPVVGGSSGHAVGATLIAILLGPSAAVIAVSMAVAIQAVLFGDGGITALGANIFNMALVMPLLGWAIYRLIGGRSPQGTRRLIAAGVGSYIGIVVASLMTGIEFGIQPLIAHTASGRPLYAPYPLSVSVPAMVVSHALVFGPLEAAVTVGVIAALAASRSPLLETAEQPARRSLAWLWIALGVLVALVPLGALAQGTAWGEWSAKQLRSTLGFVPAGFARLSGTWSAALPGYSTPGVANGSLSYLLAGIAGVCVTVALVWLLGKVLARGERRSKRSLAARTASALGDAVIEVLENEEIASRPGMLQRLDPRVKLGSLVAFAVVASVVRSPLLLAALVVLTLAVAAASRVGVASFARKTLLSAGLFAAIVAGPATTTLVTPGPVVATLGPIALSSTGLLGALTLVLRVIASAGFALLVIWTTRWTETLAALTALRVPDTIVATLAMTQKQIVTLLRTVQNMHLARESRMLAFGSTAENREWVLGRMAFVAGKSAKTADDVYDAMLSRGYSGAMRSIRRLRVGAHDLAWGASAIVAAVLVLGLDRLVSPR
jgi:cobalt/nickel transport system permease protein